MHVNWEIQALIWGGWLENAPVVAWDEDLGVPIMQNRYELLSS